MSRFDELKRLNNKTRNKLRAILSDGNSNVIDGLINLRGKLSKNQSETLNAILSTPLLGKTAKTSTSFPKKPPFVDTLQINGAVGNYYVSIFMDSLVAQCITCGYSKSS
jgi:hypothetical protein